jgi:hypothetical protein
LVEVAAMSLAVKTLVAPSLEQLAVLLQAKVGEGRCPIDNPARLYHDGKPRNGEELVQHLQRHR